VNDTTNNNDAARDAGQFIILCEERGDYLTGLRWDAQGRPEVSGGAAAEAIRYTAQEAARLIADMGRGFSAECVEIYPTSDKPGQSGEKAARARQTLVIAGATSLAADLANYTDRMLEEQMPDNGGHWAGMTLREYITQSWEVAVAH
jgi:hypothetical protein